jgi:isopenicillin N synthase-like dioxygenase
LQNGVVDKIEQYNWARDMNEHPQPTTMKPYQQETQQFTEYVHKHILYGLLRLFAKALELPSEEYLVDRHRFETFDESWMRYMAYYDEHSEDDLKKTKGVWLMGHADFGSLTLLFSQPMSSLQVRQADGTWKWVRHVPGAIVVNAGEMMQFWTGGYYKATVHRGTCFTYSNTTRAWLICSASTTR